MISDNKTPYALGAIPELIGERQFGMLIQALGWTAYDPLMSGEEFADRVTWLFEQVNRELQEKQ